WFLRVLYLMRTRPTRSSRFPYTTLFRSAGLLNYTDCVGAHHNGYNIPPTLTWDNIPETENTINASFRGWWDTPHHSWSFRSTLEDRKSTRLNSSHVKISYAVFCLKKKTT